MCVGDGSSQTIDEWIRMRKHKYIGLYSRVWNISAALLLSFEDFFLPPFSFSTYTIIHMEEIILSTLIFHPTPLLKVLICTYKAC